MKLASKVSTLPRPPWWTVCLASALMIPFLTSSVGGLTHRTSCRTAFTPDFEVLADGATKALVSSAIVLTRDDPTLAAPCPGFGVDAVVNATGPATLSAALSATNTSTSAAHATAHIAVGGKNSYIPLGVLDSGQTMQKALALHVPRGSSVLKVRLLLGG